MPATITIIEKNGVGGTPSDKTSGNIRFKNADDASVDLVAPMVIPSSGSDFSYEKWLRLMIGATPPSVQITNVRFYTDGSSGLGTGVTLWAKAVATFATPGEPANATGFSDAFGYTSEAPLTLGAGPYSTADTEIGSHLVLMLEVASTATQGATAAETMTFSYDEI